MHVSSEMDAIKTRFLIISDTHGMSFDEVKPTQHADVAIHCGDLTEESKIEEFRTTLQLLKNIDAPLKLVIAGNHDFTMDIPAYKKKVAELEARESVEPELLRKVYGDYGEARRLFEEAKAEGITFLDEGTHRFRLQNNALLTVYASPYTPAFGDWGFQYPPVEGRDFSIEKGVDVVLTHGPPQGILDRTDNKRAGCSDLFQAVARARPRLHCFGHIHVGWGAKLVTWRDQPSEKPSHFTDIDNDKSALIENLSGLRGSKFDTPEILEEKSKKLKRYEGERCRTTSHGRADPNPLHFGSQTLFVNAAIEGPSDERPVQLPWLVDIELPSC